MADQIDLNDLMGNVVRQPGDLASRLKQIVNQPAPTPQPPIRAAAGMVNVGGVDATSEQPSQVPLAAAVQNMLGIPPSSQGLAPAAGAYPPPQTGVVPPAPAGQGGSGFVDGALGAIPGYDLMRGMLHMANNAAGQANAAKAAAPAASAAPAAAAPAAAQSSKLPITPEEDAHYENMLHFMAKVPMSVAAQMFQAAPSQRYHNPQDDIRAIIANQAAARYKAELAMAGNDHAKIAAAQSNHLLGLSMALSPQSTIAAQGMLKTGEPE